MAVCLRDPLPMENRIQQYWQNVYAGNTDGIKAIVTADIVVESVVDSDGKETTKKTSGYDQLIAVVQKIHAVIHSVEDSQLKLIKESSTGDQSILEYEFTQILIIKTEEGKLAKMTSKGTQVWTANKDGLLCHLRVKETDAIKSDYVDKKGVAAVDLTGKDQPAAPVATESRGVFGCILV